MKKLIALCGIVFVANAALAQKSENRGLAVALTPVPGWASVSAKPGDDNLELATDRLGTPAHLNVWEEDEPDRSLRGVWTSLRYNVVIEKGGAILRDVPLNFGGTQGRELLYRIRENGKAEIYLDAVVIKDRIEFTAHCSLADKNFTSYASEVEKMLETARFVVVEGAPGTSAPSSTPQPAASPGTPTPQVSPVPEAPPKLAPESPPTPAPTPAVVSPAPEPGTQPSSLIKPETSSTPEARP